MLNDLLLRMRSLFRRKIVEVEMDEELRFHFANQVAKLVHSGLAPQEARRRARLEFGGMDQVKEEYRDSRGVTFIETLLQDIRYGVRTLRKNPGFAAIAVLTLALAVGASTAIFSVVDAVLLRPLPFKDPVRLVWATEHFAFGPSTVVSADFPAWKDRNHVFEEIAASGGTSGANLTGTGQPARVTVTNVTTGLFSMLGVQPIAGRAFLADEGKQDQEHVALLNEALWRNRFSADSRIIGE